MTTNFFGAQRRSFEFGDLLYRLAAAYPSWAGAFLLLYIFLSCGLSVLNTYFRQ